LEKLNYKKNVFYVPHHNGSQCEDLLKKIKPDIILLGGCRILKQNIIDIPKIGILNSHPGLLPKYRGMDVVAWAIYNDDDVGGTCHFIDSGADTGSIIIRKILNYSDCRSLIEVRVKAMKLCIDLLIKSVLFLAKNPNYKGKKQKKSDGKRYFQFPTEKLKVVEDKITKQSVFKAAIIGCGMIGCDLDDYKPGFISTHLSAYNNNKNVELTAVCDIDYGKAKKIADKNKIFSSFNNINKMMKEIRPVIVSICTPDNTHHDILKKVVKFRSVKGIWCEKPLAVTLKQGKEMVDLCNRNGIKLVVNHFRRYDPFYKKMKKSIPKIIGDIDSVVCYYSGGIVTTGSHIVDTLNYLFGKCISVSAKSFSTKGSDLYAELLYEKNLRVNLIPCDSSFSIFEINILGSKGRLDTINRPFGYYDYRYYEIEKDKRINANIIGRRSKDVFSRDIKRNFFEEALSDLIKCVQSKTNTNTQSCGGDGCKTLEIISALSYSAKNKNKSIKFPFKKYDFRIPSPSGEIKKWKN